MLGGVAQPVRVLSHTPGRVRLHLSDWHGVRADKLQDSLRDLHGVNAVNANALTRNILIHFDPQLTTPHILLAAVGKLTPKPAGAQPAPGSNGTAVRGGPALLRAGLRGLIGHALVDSVIYTVSFTQPLGLPLAGLGVVHLGLDLIAWSVALAPLLDGVATPGENGARVHRKKLAHASVSSL